MKNKPNLYNRGFAVIETILIIVIIIVIILFIWQRGRSSQSYMNNYRGSTYTTNEYTVTPGTSTTTTTTTTTNGSGSHSNETPVITLYGDNPYQLNHGGNIPVCEPSITSKCPPRNDIYAEPGYKATDKEDGDITMRVIISDEYNNATTNSPCHTYNKKYVVTDSNGNTVTARRIINECNMP